MDLLKMAYAAAENAYAPYSNLHVGAALLCKDGTVFVGCNVENASYGVSCCAERTALFSAIAAGKRDFSAVACTHTPCGICRQALSEFGDMDVITKDGTTRLSALLPEAFSLENPKAL